MRAIRLWKHLLLLKRGGIGLLAGGVRDAKPGSCAVECPACPRFIPDHPELASCGDSPDPPIEDDNSDGEDEDDDEPPPLE